MKSYIIRIYRGEKGGSGKLLGTVERPGEDIKLAFTSFDELKNILSPLAGKAFSVEVGEQQKGRMSNRGTMEDEDRLPKTNREEATGKKKKEEEGGRSVYRSRK